MQYGISLKINQNSKNIAKMLINHGMWRCIHILTLKLVIK